MSELCFTSSLERASVGVVELLPKEGEVQIAKQLLGLTVEAALSEEAQDLPIVAIATDRAGNILGKGKASDQALQDESCHAEKMALDMAEQNGDPFELHVSVESCKNCLLQCQGRVRRINSYMDRAWLEALDIVNLRSGQSIEEFNANKGLGYELRRVETGRVFAGLLRIFSKVERSKYSGTVKIDQEAIRRDLEQGLILV